MSCAGPWPMREPVPGPNSNVMSSFVKITVTEDACEKCGAYEIVVDFHKDKTPLPDQETKRVGKIFALCMERWWISTVSN